MIFSPPDITVFDPVSKLPWITKPEQLLDHSLLVEVFTTGETVHKVAESVIEYTKEGKSYIGLNI